MIEWTPMHSTPRSRRSTIDAAFGDVIEPIWGRSAKEELTRAKRRLIALAISMAGIGISVASEQLGLPDVAARVAIVVSAMSVLVLSIVAKCTDFLVPERTMLEVRAGYTTRDDGYEELPQVDPVSLRVIREAGHPRLSREQTESAVNAVRAMGSAR